MSTKTVLVAVVALVVGIVIGAAVLTAAPLGGVTIEDETFVGTVTLNDAVVNDDLTVGGQVTVAGQVVNTPDTITATTTLTVDSSPVQFLAASADMTTITLPAVTSGASFTFQVTGALTGTLVLIDSAEGDNIDGTLIVAGAVVDCRAEDQINIITDGEVIGDYVEVWSDGVQWFIKDSGVLTAGKMTCTDPS